jgi:heptosyltransferase III
MKKRKYCGNRPAKLRFILIDFFVDTILEIFGSKKNHAYVIPQKILLFNYGHLGDMLMMGYMINVLKRKYPKVEIHLVAGRWSKLLIENNLLYDKIFYLDHFQNNRQSISFFKKYFTHFKDTFLVIKALRKIEYTNSFDFRYSAYNANQLLPFLAIEQKNGFGTRGLGGLLDMEYFLLSNNTHTLDVQGQVFKNIGVDINSKSIQPLILNALETKPTLQIQSDYILIFPETGNPERMFSHDFWQKNIDFILLKIPDIQLVICGVTDFNSQLAQTLQTKYPNNIIEATKTLSIPQIINLLEKSRGAITLDSFPAHLASIKTNTLSFFNNGSGNEYFPINSCLIHIIHNNFSSKDATSFREKMFVNYVENFEDYDFKVLLESAFTELFKL